jgi:Cu/Ag efflux pump CusA
MTQPLVGGVLFSPIVVAVALALAATVVLSMVLARLGFYRLVWNRPIVEVALFCILLALVGR